MARRHGRNARIYVAATSGGTASPISAQNKWAIDGATDKQDVTAFGDRNKQYVTGLPDSKGSFGGFWDDAGAALWNAAQDGQSRRMYLYPDITNDPTVYFHGEIFVDASLDGGIAQAINSSTSWVAASDIIFTG